LKNRLKTALPFILGGYLLLLGTLSLMPNPPAPPDFASWDKAQHALAYALLAPLVWAVLSSQLSAWKRLCVSLLIAWGVGAVLELFQGLLPLGRVFEWTDLLANLTGGVAGLLIAQFALRISRGRFNHAD